MLGKVTTNGKTAFKVSNMSLLVSKNISKEFSHPSNRSIYSREIFRLQSRNTGLFPKMIIWPIIQIFIKSSKISNLSRNKQHRIWTEAVFNFNLSTRQVWLSNTKLVSSSVQQLSRRPRKSRWWTQIYLVILARVRSNFKKEKWFQIRQKSKMKSF